jgi:hypothetical protein
MAGTRFSATEGAEVAHDIGIEFKLAGFSVDELRIGMHSEAEKQHRPSETILTPAEKRALGRLAMNHLLANSSYYTPIHGKSAGD